MTPLLRLAAGAGAGIVGMSATYPLDMVRGRLTVQGERKTSQYRGIWDCTRQIIKQARPPGRPGCAPAPNTTGVLAK
jgi:solute carrier family 25 phosphate transporter 23/24/25/41